MKVTFVRHGQTEANQQGIANSLENDVVLTSEGIEQARGIKLNDKYSQVYCSPAIRTQQTAIYAGFENFIVDNRINEMDSGLLAGTKPETHPEIYNRINKLKDECGGFNNKFSDKLFEEFKAERKQDVEKRINEFLEDIPDNSLVFSHKGIIQTIIMMKGGKKTTIDNCQIVEFII